MSTGPDPYSHQHVDRCFEPDVGAERRQRRRAEIRVEFLQEFQTNGHQPVYPASFVLPPPTPEQVIQAAPYKNAPTDAVVFFNQLGTAVATNPIPNRGTGLSGTALNDLPAWVVPHGAKTIYRVPSYGQKAILDSFAPLGLTKNGFRIPADWGIPQPQALQDGYEQGQQILDDFIANAAPDASTNYWGIVNDVVGTYPNNELGYLFRSLIAVEGGVANVPLDAVYPTLTGNPEQLNGDNTYTLTFTPPTSSNPTPVVEPVEGIYPPMVSDSSGNQERLLVDPRLRNGSNGKHRPLHRPNQCPEHQLLDCGYARAFGECRPTP